jgi:hypothetical protein
MYDLFAIDVPDRGKGSNQAKQNGNPLNLCGITNTIHFAHDAIPFERSGNPGSKLLIFSSIVLEISYANRYASRECDLNLSGLVSPVTTPQRIGLYNRSERRAPTWLTIQCLILRVCGLAIHT